MSASGDRRLGLTALVGEQLARESGWVVAGQITSALVMVVGIRVITEVVPSEVFGQATLVLGGLSLAHGLLFRPLLEALLRYRPEAERHDWSGGLLRVLMRLMAGAFGAATGLVLATALAWGWATGGVWPWAVAAAALLWLAGNTVVRFWMNLFNADRRQARVAILQTLSEVAKPVGVVVLVLLAGATVTTYVVGQALLLAALALCCSILVVGRGRGESRLEDESPDVLGRSVMGLLADRAVVDGDDSDGNRRIRRRVLDYALPLIPLAGVSWGIHIGDRYILELYQGSAAVGVYAAAYGLASGPFRQLSSTAIMIFRPYLFEAGGESPSEVVVGRGVHVRRWLMFILGVGGPGLLVLSVGREWFGRLLLAPEYREGAELFPVVGAAYLVLALGKVWEHRLLARELSRKVLLSSTISFVVSLSGAFLLIPQLGLWGAAWSTLAGSGAYLLCNWILELKNRGALTR